MTIKELKNKWNKEKSFYRTQELGSGLHGYIHDFLQSEELFALKKGLLSTQPELRKKEYIHEKKAKEKRQADFVIYISPEIVIPLEAERYGNIEAGVKQLFDYQKDFEKQYGILTDGYTWRFYNNNIYRSFSLGQIFDETDIFIEFWTEYIKPEFYYLSFFEPQGQLSLLRATDKLPVDQNRQIFFEDITRLIRSFKNKLQVEGYFKGLGKKEREKLAVEITYAYIIQFILYKTLVDNDFGKFRQEFEKSVNNIHEHIKTRRYKDILGIIDGISAQISKNIYRPFAEEQAFISQKLLELYQSVENKLSDVSPWLDIFVFIKKYNFTDIQNEIFGYIYENYLKELYQEEQKGQYFTDPVVVNFMLEQIGFTPEKLTRRYGYDKNSISLIDSACGSGTFLYSAVDRVIKAFGNHSEEESKRVEEIISNNIIGLDIAEFPLYLAEMNILMRMLPMIITEKYNNPVDKKIKVFLTKDSVAEFMDTALRNTIHDIDVKSGQLSWDFKDLDLGYKSYVREETDLEEMKKSLEEQARIPRRRFDYVIGNPPYIGYNDCSKQKILIFELMKQGKAKLNNIYGVNLHSIPSKSKRYRPNPNLYAFFIALGIALLKDNGRLCYIVPQTILTAGDLDVLRYHMAKFTTIEKIITFPNALFIGRGLKQKSKVATSSLIFVLSREKPSFNHQVEIINYKNPEEEIEKILQDILQGRHVSKKKILQGKLINNIASWNFIKLNKSFFDFYDYYSRNTDDIVIYYEHSLAVYTLKSKFYFDSGYSIDERKLLSNKPNQDYYYYPKLSSETWKINDCRGFWPNIREGKSPHTINLRQANQGYNLLDSKYKVVWSYANPRRFYFTSLPLIWARNQYCAIGSDNKKEILYLFALLNSPVIGLVLHSNLKSEHEKSFLVSTTAIKEFVRVPKITKNNQLIKDEIIQFAERMLFLEDKRLSDFFDFSKILSQKFDKVRVVENNLVLKSSSKEYRLAIKENISLVKKTVEEEFDKRKLALEPSKIIFSELKNLPVIDFDTQMNLKNYVDDLVFALYFNVALEKLGLNYAQKIREKCAKSPYYIARKVLNLNV